MIDKSKVKKILIIKLRGIGDVVLSTIILDNLKADFPDAEIDYLTEKPSKQAIEKIPHINNVIVFNRKDNLDRFKLHFKIRSMGYNLVFDFYSNPATALLTWFSGARYRVGFPYRGRKFAYNNYGPEERAKYHAAELHTETLRSAGLKHTYNKLYYGIDDNDISSINKKIGDITSTNGLIVGISPSGGWSSKRCEPEKFAKIADEAVKRYGARVIIVWGPEDKQDAEAILSCMKNEAILAPPTTIREMGALLSLCNLVVANDSGPMHISTAVGTPTLAIHGPTDPKLQGPYGGKHESVRLESLHCIGCNLLECPYNHECFKDLPVEDVMRKLDAVIRKNNMTDKIHEEN